MSRSRDRPGRTASGSTAMSPAASSGGGSSGGNNDSNNVGRPSGGQPGAAGLGRSALISDLVTQLKRGDITKTELFSRLQQFQGPASAMAVATAGGSAGISASCTDGGGTAPANLLAGNVDDVAAVDQALTGSPATASSGESSTGVAGVAAAGSAGFFSAYDRQVGWYLRLFGGTTMSTAVRLVGLLAIILVAKKLSAGIK